MIHISTGVYISSPRPSRGIRPVPGASQQLTELLPEASDLPRGHQNSSPELFRKFRPTALSSSELPPEHHTPLTSHSSSRKGRLPLAPTSTTAVGPIRSRGKVEGLISLSRRRGSREERAIGRRTPEGSPDQTRPCRSRTIRIGLLTLQSLCTRNHKISHHRRCPA